MSDMNRRNFLVVAGAAAAAVLSLPVLQAHAEPPAGGPATKPSKPIDVGTLKSFDKDGVTATWAKKSGHFFIIREDGKLYACTSLCTHKNRPLQVKGDELYCPAHKSEFTFQGTVTAGPAKRSLPRYGISVDDSGHVLVDCTKEFTESKWDDAASFVKISA